MKCFCSKSEKVQKDQRFIIPAWSTEQVWLFLCSQTQGGNEQLLQALYLFIFLSGLWQAEYWNSFILVYIISVDYEFLFLCEGTYSKDSKSTTGGNESRKLKRKDLNQCLFSSLWRHLLKPIRSRRISLSSFLPDWPCNGCEKGH